jgi:hypothetical protein
MTIGMVELYVSEQMIKVQNYDISEFIVFHWSFGLFLWWLFFLILGLFGLLDLFRLIGRLLGLFYSFSKE